MDVRAFRAPQPYKERPNYGAWTEDGRMRFLDHVSTVFVILVLGLLAYFR